MSHDKDNAVNTDSKKTVLKYEECYELIPHNTEEND
jgi:hypothetical protein